MVFNRKGSFFLNLDEKAPAAPAKVAPVAAAPAKAEKKAKSEQPAVLVKAGAGEGQAASTAAAAAEPAAEPSAKVLTTAEAIAAELAAEQAARPEATIATFAPDCVIAGGALPMRRRRGGANLAGFRTMAGSLFGKK